MALLRLSANEKFVIIAGGNEVDNDMIHGDINYNDKLFVLDISDDNGYKLKESSIKPPNTLSSQMILMGGEIEDELLVIGWIKQLFETKEFKKILLPPMYIMKMIGLW